MEGRDFVNPEHIIKIAAKVLGHRIILSYEATIDKMNAGEMATKIARALI